MLKIFVSLLLSALTAFASPAQALTERDARDMGRTDAPLRAAEDALVLDTSDLSIDAAVARAVAAVAAALQERRGQ